MKKIWAILSAAVIALIAVIFRRKQSQRTEVVEEPPDDKSAKVATKIIKDDLKEELDRIESATTGDSPADDLADLGNARRR